MIKIFLCLLALMAGAAHADSDEKLKSIYKLPVWLDQIKRVCPWKSKASEGYIRLIRTETGNWHQLYLQWVRKGIADVPTQAISTIQVEELSRDMTVKLEMPEASLHPGYCQLSVKAEDVITERRYDVLITLKGPGDYELQKTILYDGRL